MTTIKKGINGADVKTLQQALNKVGNYGLREDGIFGLKTEVALKDYQKKYGLTPDG